MAKTYRVPSFVSVSNRVIKLILRAGMKPGAMALLTVRGRKSGLPRTTPMAIDELPPVEAAPILKQLLVDIPGFLLKNFEATPTSSLDEFEREARHHPVFQLRPGADKQSR